jgi:hypothetical protein
MVDKALSTPFEALRLERWLKKGRGCTARVGGGASPTVGPAGDGGWAHSIF